MSKHILARIGLASVALTTSQAAWAAGYPALPEVPFTGVGVTHAQMRDTFSIGPGPITPSGNVNSGNPGVQAVRLGPAVPLTLFPATAGLFSVCGTTGAAAGCAFVDAFNTPGVGYHYQGLFHRPVQAAGVAAIAAGYNFVGRDGFGNVYRVPIFGHDPGETLAFHLLTPPGVDGLPGGLLGQDLGIGRAGIWSRLPGTLDGNLWVGEGLIPDASMLADGWTPFFGNRLWLRGYSEMEFGDEGGTADGPDLDLLASGESLQEFHPELDAAVVAAIPVPAAVWLFGSALAALALPRRKASGGPA